MKTWFYIFFSISTVLSWAQEKKISVLLNPQQILIGQQAELIITAEFPAQESIAGWPIFKDTLAPKIEVVKQSKIDTSFDNTNITQKLIRQTIIITSFDSGFHAIAPISFQIGDSLVSSEAMLLQVSTVPIDTTKGIYDIKEPYEVPFNLLEWLKQYKYHIAIGLIAIIVIGIILFFVLTRNKNVAAPIIVKPKIPAHKTALKKLKDLEHRKLWQNGKTKQYHSELSEIVREYIELRFNIPALENTTGEIQQSFQNIELSSESKSKLNELLLLSDLVKFAKQTPISSENETSMKNALAFVEQTKLKENNKNG